MHILLLFVLIMACFGCQRQSKADLLQRSQVDRLNKEAFINRYRDTEHCLAYSERALRLAADSMPSYIDGQLRAYNNMAFAYYQKSDVLQATKMLGYVDTLLARSGGAARNADIEWVIAQLHRACLLQRQCHIAESYHLLYEVEQSGLLNQNRSNLLYDYARAEYYITALVLNFHYRNGEVASLQSMLEEIEADRGSLEVDYAQDMALNYALAYGWHCSGDDERALDYCEANFALLEKKDIFCLYHYANTLQMAAVALEAMPDGASPDSVLSLYNEAREAFFEYADPYQMLGGVSSTADYALAIGDTAFAHYVLRQWMDLQDVWQPFSAPKLEVGLFDVLIRSRLASSPDENRRWYECHNELQSYVAANEKADFDLQQQLYQEQKRGQWMTRMVVVLGVGLLAVLLLLFLLWRRTFQLRREKALLEQAKRRDVERIANVETCLGVLRHDVSPFVGYLRNPNLPSELRDEVLGKLLRTFDNIKQWTRLSVPEGLTFHAECFPLQQVLDEVRGQLPRGQNEVSLVFEPTQVEVWADRLLLIIMLRNLVLNALQHTEQGSVKVSASMQGEMVEISVSDTGCGMDATQVDALFKADRQLATGSEHGFGLILCRYIVQKHDDLTHRGCRLQVESSPSVGTTMRITLASASQYQTR
ncbi:MAG: DUF5112 domain-containing protein [Bacteroidales bacterium]|nr:DUF5112 domain-containing protein [Bacteroidales bacterium]